MADAIIDLVGPNAAAFQGGVGGDAAEFLGRHRRQRSERLDERRADAVEDGDVEHGDTSDGLGERPTSLFETCRHIAPGLPGVFMPPPASRGLYERLTPAKPAAIWAE